MESIATYLHDLSLPTLGLIGLVITLGMAQAGKFLYEVLDSAGLTWIVLLLTCVTFGWWLFDFNQFLTHNL